jgi:CrcB protein
MWKTLVLVFLGGGLGSVARTLIGRWVAVSGFPWGTFLVNLLGSFLIGCFMPCSPNNSWAMTTASY